MPDAQMAMYIISPAPRGRRAEVPRQPRDECVQRAAAEGALGASGRARKHRGRREAGDVDVARRRRDHELVRSVGPVPPRYVAWLIPVRFAVSRATKASDPPAKALWAPPTVPGKLVDCVCPATYTSLAVS